MVVSPHVSVRDVEQVVLFEPEEVDVDRSHFLEEVPARPDCSTLPPRRRIVRRFVVTTYPYHRLVWTDEVVVVLILKVSVVHVFHRMVSVVRVSSWVSCRTPILVPRFADEVRVFEVRVFSRVR